MNYKYINALSSYNESLPIFFNYIEKFKIHKQSNVNLELSKSNVLGSYSIIEPPDKIISSIIDYTKI